MSDSGLPETYPDDDADHGPAPRREMHWPTVMVTVSLSALVSALILVAGVVAFVVIADKDDRGARDDVIAALASGGCAQAAAPAAGPAAPTPAGDAPGTSAAPTTGAAPTGAAPQAAPAPPTQAAPAPPAQATSAVPPVPDQPALQGRMAQLLTPGTSDATIAAELEAGAAGVSVIRGVADRLAPAGPAYQWHIENLHQNGDVLDATLVTKVVGFAPRSYEMRWVARDGAWKLSNPSLCLLAQLARVNCPV